MITNFKARISLQTLQTTAESLVKNLLTKKTSQRLESVAETISQDDDVLQMATDFRNNNTVIGTANLCVYFIDENKKLRAFLFMPICTHENEMRDYVFIDSVKDEIVISLTNNVCFQFVEDDKLLGIDLPILRDIQHNTVLIVTGLEMLPNPTSEYVVIETIGTPYNNHRIHRGILETEVDFIKRLLVDKSMCKDLIASYIEARKSLMPMTDCGDAESVRRVRRSRFSLRHQNNTLPQTHLFIAGENISLVSLEKVFTELSENFFKYIETLFNKFNQFAKEMEKLKNDEDEAHREFYLNLDLLKD